MENFFNMHQSSRDCVRDTYICIELGGALVIQQ